METNFKDMEINKVVFEDETDTAIFCKVYVTVKRKFKKGWFRRQTVSVYGSKLFRLDKFWLNKRGTGISYDCGTNEAVHGELSNLMSLAYKRKGEVILCSWDF